MDVVLSRLGTQLLTPSTDELLFREPPTFLSRYVYPKVYLVSISLSVVQWRAPLISCVMKYIQYLISTNFCLIPPANNMPLRS